MCEVWIMMLYLQLDLLKEIGTDHFDARAQAFAKTTTGVEMKPDGSGLRVHTRFNKFVNPPELSRLWRQCLDVRTPEQLNLPRPSVVGGSPIIVSAPACGELIKFVGKLSHLSERVRRREVHSSVDDMRKITSEGRKAALDMRLVRPCSKSRPRARSRRWSSGSGESTGGRRHGVGAKVSQQVARLFDTASLLWTGTSIRRIVRPSWVVRPCQQQ